MALTMTSSSEAYSTLRHFTVRLIACDLHQRTSMWRVNVSDSADKFLLAKGLILTDSIDLIQLDLDLK